MTRPDKNTPDKEKFAPQNVADADEAKDHKSEFKGRDLPRGSEVETRAAAQRRT